MSLPLGDPPVPWVDDPLPFSLDRLADLYEMREERVDRRGMTFWRHDVDFSPEAAEKMGRFEREMGVRGTYYLIAGPFYDDGAVIELTMLLSNLGHRVGWHVDTRWTPTDKIAEAVGHDVPVSFHCPRQYELWKPYDFDCAYAPYWKDRYYADSRGRFSHGDPERDIRNVIQINLHPEWWFEPDWHVGLDQRVYEDFWYEPIDLLAARS